MLSFLWLVGSTTNFLGAWSSRQLHTNFGFTMVLLSLTINTTLDFFYLFSRWKFCLLCDKKFKNKNLNLLQTHCKTEHESDVNNFLYKNLFKKDRTTVTRNKCTRFDYFYMNGRNKKKHDILEYYQIGGRNPFENRLVNFKILYENLNHYSIFSTTISTLILIMTLTILLIMVWIFFRWNISPETKFKWNVLFQSLTINPC